MKLIFLSIVFATILLHHSSQATPALKRDARSIESTTECVIIVGVKKVKEGISRHAHSVKDGIHTGLNFLTGGLFKKKTKQVQPQQPDDEYKGLDYAIDVRMSPDGETEERQKRDADEEVTVANDTQGKDNQEIKDAANNESNDTGRSLLIVPSLKKGYANGRYRDLIFFE
ncbi:unnamed protein product [Diamesa serratosioi]